MIEKSFIITGISNNLNIPKEFIDIKVYKQIKEKNELKIIRNILKQKIKIKK